MKKGFKGFLMLSITACGVFYVAYFMNLESKDIYHKEIRLDLIDKGARTQENEVHEGLELLLVNREQGLSKGYIPEGLAIPNIEFADESNKEERHVAGIIIEPIENLVNSAREEGIILLGNSAYRSYKSQEKVYKDRVKSDGLKLAAAYVAKPGFSEHQTGLCIDITNGDRYFVKGTREADWLAENCHRFGFIIRYPEGKKIITGIEYEPWHIRYVGEGVAKDIYENGITLEEYLVAYIN